MTSNPLFGCPVKLGYFSVKLKPVHKRLYSLLLVVLLTGLFMTSCRAPKDLVFKNFSNVKLENLGFAGSKLTMDLQYYNPNNFGLELSRTDFDLFVDSTFLGHSSQNLQVKVPSRDVFTVPLAIDLDMKNLLKNGLNSLFSKQVNVRLLGNVKLGKAGVYKNFKVDYTTVQQLSMFR